MDNRARSPAKLQKRKSRERQELAMSGGLSGQPANSSQPLSPPKDIAAEDKKKKSKFRLSNPFHSKEKEKERDDDQSTGQDLSKRNTLDTNADSAYQSAESTNPSFSSNANPSFVSSNPRPVSGEQWHSPLNTRTTPPPERSNLLPPTHSLQNQSSHEDIKRNTYQDAGTGVTVTTVTTTTTTTTTTTGPGGSTTVQKAVDNNGPSEGSIINTSGPSPPSPMPPLPPSQQPVPGATNTTTTTLNNDSALLSGTRTQHENITPPMQANLGSTLHGTQHDTAPGVDIPQNSSPPIPAKNNIRNRLELDSVSPAVQKPNPLDAPVSPITPSSPSNKANFSYPSRAPPQGVPRKVLNQQTPQQWGESWNEAQHGGYDESSRPTPYRAGHAQDSQTPVHNPPQRQATLANLKAAAHGIHGAGEALRGAFNDTVDRRFAPADSAVHAKNRAVIEAGRSEIETQNFAYRSRPPARDAPPVPPIPGSAAYNQAQHNQDQYNQVQHNQVQHNQGPYNQGQYNQGQHNPAQHNQGQQDLANTPYQGPPISGSQVEGRSDGRNPSKLSGFMKKMKEGSMVSNRDGTVSNH